MSDNPGVYQSRLDFLRDFFEERAPRDILIADSVDAMRVPWDWSLRIHQARQTPDLLLALTDDDADFDDAVPDRPMLGGILSNIGRMLY